MKKVRALVVVHYAKGTNARQRRFISVEALTENKTLSKLAQWENELK